ncbi:transposase [Streptomyces sp. AJS327]|uniref:IS701 family transposase n=1 Tax=Streptomyces sp. AJS327 TaxID=2545265 RepID=UPI0027E4B99C|nr:transposase [Streptomyces sp. AJS327]
MAAELSSALFTSLRRTDQRLKARQYLDGLLHASGRKSMRNIAARVGTPAAEQSMHHFISDSTWDWTPIRRKLACGLEECCPSTVWVVRSLFIPKTGRHSVGVEQHVGPGAGQTMSGQSAYGVWMTGASVSAPVNWRLCLPPSWARDPVRRRRAAIPADVVEERAEECATAVALDTARRWGLTPRPILLDTELHDLGSVFRRVRSANVPLISRVGDTARLEVADPAMPGFGGGRLPAQRILASVRGLRRTAVWADPAAGGVSRTSLVAAVRVQPPGTVSSPQVAGGPGALLLVGEWSDPGRPPVRMWLTDMTEAAPEALLALSKFGRRAARDLVDKGNRVGLYDFEGRSFPGWHRHMTLASVAYASLRGDCLGARGGPSPAGPV